MSEQNDRQKEETGCCAPGCCGASGSGGQGRWIVGGVILLIAGVLVARAVVKNNGDSATPASAGFAALP